MLDLLVNKNTTRPNKVTPESKYKGKDENYHLDMSKYYLGASINPVVRDFQTKCLIDWAFYQGNQWIYNDDLEPFLMDESGDVRNRIRFVLDICSPKIRQYIGNIIRIDYKYKAVSISDGVINRMERELNSMRLRTIIAKKAGGFYEDTMKSMFPIGDSIGETDDIFDNYYTDTLQQGITNLIQNISDRNEIDTHKVRVAENLGVTGLGILKGYEQNGEQIWEVTDPDRFLFDTNARRPDLKDGEFMGEYNYMGSTDVFERWQNISTEQKRLIEESVRSNNQNTNWLNNFVGWFYNKVPIVEMYWKDGEYQEYGWVKDEFGYDFFTRINGDDGNDGKPKYTDKNLVKSKNKAYSDILDGKKKTKIWVDNLSYCIFTPGEYVQPLSNEQKSTDIVYEYGQVPHQEVYMFSPSNVEYPYKCGTFKYHNGVIWSPMDMMLDIQRYINRISSMAESNINNSRMGGSAIEKNAITNEMDEAEINRNMNLGKPIVLDTGGIGITNAVGEYHNTGTKDTYEMYKVVDVLKGFAEGMTGINEAMTGEGGGQRELKSVTEAMIQRGSLIQEDYYFAITEILRQTYRAMAQQGKQIYADNPRKLAIMTGDERAEAIIITKDMLMEDFRIDIKRVAPEDKTLAMQECTRLFSGGLLDAEGYAKTYWIGTMDDVARELRRTLRKNEEMKKKMAQQKQQQDERNEQQQQGMIQDAKDQQQSKMANDNKNAQADRNVKLLGEAIKQQGKTNQQQIAK